jgi:hypothetical protein
VQLEPNPYASPHGAAELQPRRAASSGGVHWVLFPLAVVGGLVAAGAIAWGLAALYAAGMYWMFMAPAGAGLAMAAALYFLLRLGQCRNRWLGLALGVVCGCVLYLGYFQIDMARRLGPEWAWRIDALPGFIAFRIRTDVAGNMNQPGGREPKPFWQLNLGAFCGELAFVLWFTSVVGFRTASRAFDETRGRWGKVAYAALPYGQSQSLIAGQQEGRLADVLQRLVAVPIQYNSAHCLLVLERFAASADEPPRAFLSAYEMRMPGQVAVINELMYCKRLALRQVELTPVELAACEALVSHL